MNIHTAIDTYWNTKFVSNITNILRGIEDKNYDDAADRLKKLYENDFQNLSTNLETYLVDGDKENNLLPFRLNQVIDDILDDTFKAICEIAYSKGLFSLSHALEYFDEKIDDFELEYEKRLKELPSKKSIVTVDDNVIIVASKRLAIQLLQRRWIEFVLILTNEQNEERVPNCRGTSEILLLN